MPLFTLPNGATQSFSAADFVRFRPSLPFELKNQSGTTLFKPLQIVLNPIDEVAPAMLQQVPSFVRLTSPSGTPQWVDAKKTGDAQVPRPGERGKNTDAVVLVGGVRLRLRDSVADVQAVLDAGRSK